MKFRRPGLLAVVLAAALALPCGTAVAADLLESTLPLRTALHQDPTLDAPLDRLVDAWRGAGRMQDLIAVYNDHLTSYPEDRNALIVLLRLELAAGDPAAAPGTAGAVTARPADAYLWWLRSRALAAARDGGALDALDKAVTLETTPWRKRAWAARLVEEALKAGRPELAREHLAAAAGGDDSPAGRLATARRQAQAGLHDEALATLAGITGAEPELGVEADLVAAEEEVALKRTAAAAKRLDAVLARLAADHWRRAEVLRQRIELAGEGAEREALLTAAAARAAAAPGDDAAAIDHARLLTAIDRRQEALAVLLAACARAATPRLEQEALAAFDRVHDLAALDAWLAGRLAADPARGDLALRRVRVLLDREQRDAAWALLDATLERLPAGEGDDRLLALGRELARANRGADAQQALGRLHTRRPERLDVTRELADACLAGGRRDRAEALFAPGVDGRMVAATAAPEQVLETVDFLIAKRLLAVAARLADERLADDPGHFELRLAAVRLAARLGDGAAAEAKAAAARPLADSAPRYRRWLEALLEAAGEERRAAVLTAEHAALGREAGDWDEVRAGRHAAFAEACIAADQRALAGTVLRTDIEQAPPEGRAPLHRALAALLTAPEDVAELRTVLAALAEEDPAAAPDALARRALIGLTDEAGQGQTHGEGSGQLPEGFAAIDPRQLSEPQVLERCWRVFADAGAQDKATACAERLVQLEPADPARWERWCTALVAGGDEAGLRAALRRLLAGVENLPLVPAVRDQLQDALLASAWRSCARLAAGGGWKDLLALAAETEPLTRTAEQGRWLAWARCLGLARLGRVKLPEAIAELERRCADDQAIAFPDGLATSLAAARSLFTTATVPVPPPAARRGPLPPWVAAWAFTTPGRVVALLPAADALLVCDGGGRVSAVDPRDGRLRWWRDGLVRQPEQSGDDGFGSPFPGAFPGVPVPPNAGNLLPALAGADSGAGATLLAAIDGDAVVALATADGALRWRSTLLTKPTGVVASGDVVVAWSDLDGVCLGFDAATGRLRWSLDLPELAPRDRAPLPAVAADAGRIVIVGTHGGVIDAGGQLLWSAAFDEVAQPVPAFTANAAAALPAATPWPMRYGGNVRYLRYLRHRARMAAQQAQPFTAYISTGAGGSAVSTMVFNPAQAPGTRLASGLLAAAVDHGAVQPVIVAGQLLLASGGELALTDLALPLAVEHLPAGVPAGAWGRRLLLLREDGATVRDLATGLERDLDLGPLRPVVEAGALDGEAPPALSHPVAALDGRLAWLGGPRGLAAFDLESGALVAEGSWPAEVAPAAEEAHEDANPNPGAEPAVAPDAWSATDQRVRGAVVGGRLVLPVGGRRIVALGRGGDGR